MPRFEHQPEWLVVIVQLGAIKVQVEQRGSATARAIAQAAVRDHDLLDRLRRFVERLAEAKRAPHPV